MNSHLRILAGLPDAAERATLREAIRGIEGAEVLGYPGTGTEAVQMNAASRPDVALLAADLPALDGYQAAELISLHSPATHILIVDAATGAPPLQRALDAGARGLLGRPLEMNDLVAALRRLAERERQREGVEFVYATDPARAPVMVAVCGAKDGVGKTTLATNLAAALARLEPGGAAIVDLYPQFGNVGAMLDAHPRRTLADLANAGEEMDAEVIRQLAAAHESGLAVFIGSLTPQPLDIFSAEFVEALLAVLRREYRYLVLDVPPMLHAGTLAALSRAEHLLVVCGLTEVPTVACTRCMIDVLLEGYVSTDRLHVVLNRVARGAPLQVAEVEEALGRKVSAQIPNDERRVVASVNDGSPAVLSQPASPAAAAMLALAERIHRRLPIAAAAEPHRQRSPLRLPFPRPSAAVDGFEIGKAQS